MDDVGLEKSTAPVWRGFTRHAVDLWRRAAGLVLPPACPGCGRILSDHGAICISCWQGLHFIERPYCEILGTPFSHDLGDGIVSAEAIANPPPFDRLRAACLYDGVAKNLVHALKFRDRTELAGMMAHWMMRAGGATLSTCDLAVPVPLHLWRRLSRKFNQAAELARALSERTDVEFMPDALRRKRNTRHQIGLGRAAREDNVRGAFEMTSSGKSAVFGKHVLLVDDVYTTGATVASATRTLKRAGAREVTVLVFASALSDII
jgi:ComF family protein